MRRMLIEVTITVVVGYLFVVWFLSLPVGQP